MKPTDRIRFDRLNLDDGLSQSAVLCILQDSLGFMWFGTQDGLNRYDGRKFTVYKCDDSDNATLSSNYILDLCEDSDGFIWVATSSGVCKYNRERDTFERFTSKISGSAFPVDQVRSVAQGRDGSVYLATYGGGLSILDPATGSISTFGNDPDNSYGLSYPKLNCVFVDSSDNIFVGTWGRGVDIYDPRQMKFEKVQFDIAEDSISHKRINHISENSEGNKLISTNGGLFILEKIGGTAIQAELPAEISEQKAQLISFAMEDSLGNLWIGTREKGLWLKRHGSNYYVNYLHDELISSSISNNSVTCICQDASGLMWTGTYGDGLCKFSPKKSNVIHFFHDPRDNKTINTNKIYCFTESRDGKIWIGTRGMGVSVLDPLSYDIVPFKHKGYDLGITGLEVVLSLEADKDGIIWIGTSGGGLLKYDPSTDELFRYSSINGGTGSISNDTVYVINADSRNRIWIGTAGGLNVFDKSASEFRCFKNNPEDSNTLSSDRVRDLCIGDDGTIWIATEYGGLNCMDMETGKVIRQVVKQGAEIDRNVYCVEKGSDGSIWAGTPSGLYKLDLNSGFCVNIDERKGLPNNNINSIEKDDDNYIWVTTNNGVAKVSMNGKVVAVFNKGDGFQGNEFTQHSSLKLMDGRILFGGINGFNIFDPGGFSKSGFRPNLVFTEFRLFNEPVMPAENSLIERTIWSETNLRLTYRESVISICFAAMDFRSSGNLKYKYLLENFDRDWVDASESGIATYTNLDPGDYEFKVMCSNSEGEWGESCASLGLNISPPFWRTKWFRALSAFSLVGAGGMIYKRKLDQVRKEKKAQEELTRRVIDAQEADRKRIATELHDSIGHGLLISKNQLQLNLNEGKLDADTSKNIAKVSEILSGTLQEVREISYNLHPYQLERLGLTKAIRSIVDRVSESSGVSFICSVDEIENLLPPQAEITLYRIIQESVNNILKHSHATEALLNVSKNHREISVLISDNGKGFDAKSDKRVGVKHGIGLAGMKERAKIINASIEFSSAIGEGTEVMLKIPLKEGTHESDIHPDKYD